MTPTRVARRALRPVRVGAVRVLRAEATRRLLRRSHDASSETSQRSCLVVAPHQDDEVLGCGGSIALRRRAGQAVTVVWLTDGRHSQRSAVVSPPELAALRRTEATRALDLLGVAEPDLHFLGVEDGTAREHVRALVSQVRALVEQVAPDDVLVTSPLDGHPDHVTAAEVVCLAVRGLSPAPRVLTYPVWSWFDWPWSAVRGPLEGPGRHVARARSWAAAPGVAARSVDPSHVDIRSVLDLKRAALQAHRSQFENITGEATWTTFGPDFAPRFLRSREFFFTA